MGNWLLGKTAPTLNAGISPVIVLLIWRNSGWGLNRTVHAYNTESSLVNDFDLDFDMFLVTQVLVIGDLVTKRYSQQVRTVFEQLL